MNIKKLVESLSDKELKELKNYLLIGKMNENKTDINDFLKENENILTPYLAIALNNLRNADRPDRIVFIDDIRKIDLVRMPYIGEKKVNEFLEIRRNYK